MSSSVWHRALGDQAGLLAPELQRYFALPPSGMVGVGEGVYERAGSPRRWLWPVLAFLGWRRILFPEYGTDIPFTVTNIPTAEGTLRAIRTFAFAARTRVMVDEMRIVDGHLHDFLGRRGGLEARLQPTVSDGMLHLTTTRLWLHLGPLRVPLPSLARIRLTERTTRAAQHVSVTLHSPLLGDWFVYTGSFTYRYVSSSDPSAAQFPE
ncbi:MAG: DUF4166 domain-containing protein [Microbacteriaceae bacterium]